MRQLKLTTVKIFFNTRAFLGVLAEFGLGDGKSIECSFNIYTSGKNYLFLFILCYDGQCNFDCYEWNIHTLPSKYFNLRITQISKN
jgi:hypothetical protein